MKLFQSLVVFGHDTSLQINPGSHRGVVVMLLSDSVVRLTLRSSRAYRATVLWCIPRRCSCTSLQQPAEVLPAGQLLAEVLQVPEQLEPGSEQVRHRQIRLLHPDHCLHEQSLRQGVTIRAGSGSGKRLGFWTACYL
ncbi:hypothetical protein [Pectobacterium phage PEAT2]|uniref:Uncharacterized protein n=1 Tax=Pectobacterium phage PEAT2 TaxID=2053078 RepID=A0A2H4N7E3_9CAUD|nr:hypothetical protein F8206_gp06 [Pectobacterium phage PEAT2]ATV25111.1 hypothetical protein [Pectobacterium phage PEAT2]